MQRLWALPLAIALQVWPTTTVGIWLLLGAIAGVAIAYVCVRYALEA